MGYSLEITNCRVCCSDTKTTTILEQDPFVLKKCDTCGVTFSEKRIVKNEIFTLLENVAPSAFNDPLLGRKKELGRVTEANAQLDLIEKYIKPGKIYDVGAAGGTFLSIARARKWEIFGNEVSKACVYIAKRRYDINLRHGFVEEESANGDFSAVVLWNVLEHLYEPYQELSHIYNMLSPTGVILIKIPLHTEETIKQYHMLPEHLFNFSETSLDILLSSVRLYRVETFHGFDDKIPTLTSIIKKQTN